jgi:hypothetical protein
LRNFDNKLFQKLHDTVLLEEDDWLEKLDKITKAWWEKMGSNNWQPLLFYIILRNSETMI